MYVDPLLLVALLVLLVGTSVLAAVAYVRYRRCEDVYQAYGRARTTPAPAPPPISAPDPADDRYVTGADYAEVPTLDVALPDAAPPAAEPEPPPITSEPEPPVAQLPPILVESPPEPAALAPAESDTFFYEYTAQGFVPVDPYEPEMSSPPAAEPTMEIREMHGFAGDEHFDDAPRPAETERRSEAPAPVASEDGFVWL